MNELERFRREGHTRGRGRWAEENAIGWLEVQGYRIIKRNWTSSVGEIDVVAIEADTLSFLEIKARATSEFGTAIESVTRRKQLRLGRAASLYLAEFPWDGPCRFDVLGLDLGTHGWEYTLIRGAFEL